jgi:hypothetical protein
MKIIRYILVMLFLTNTILIKSTEKQVLVVSMSLPAGDAIIQKMIDRVNSIEGVTAVYMNLVDYNLITDFTAYDAALITESGGSSSMTTLADQGWQIPVVNLKAYSLYKGTHPLFYWDDSTFLGTEKSAELLPGINWLFVIDNNDIFSEYQVGDSILWTTGYNTTIGTGAGEAHIQAFDLFKSHEHEIVENSTPLASNKYLVDQAFQLQNFMWKTEENSYTKRIVSWGIHHDFLEYATDEFYKILVNAVKWVLKIQQPATLQSLTVDHGSIYPAFSPNFFNYKLAVDSSVDSVLITAISFEETDTVIGSGYFTNIPGIAAIRVISVNADTGEYVIDISNHTEIPQLSGLIVSGAKLKPLFNPDTINYIAKIDPEVTSVMVDAFPMDGDVTVTGTGNLETIPGTAIIKVISAYGITNNYYVHVVYKSAARLSTLALSNGILTSPFNPETLQYRFSIEDEPDSIMISAGTNDQGAVIKGTGYFASIPGDAIITVVSEDSLITEYIIKVFYGKSDASLSSLYVSKGKLEPSFDPEILNYQLYVPFETDSLYIFAVAENENAKVSGDGTFVTDLPESITIVVVAEDSTILEYEINIVKSFDVLVVSAASPEDDLITRNLMDCVGSIEGVTAIFMDLPTYNTLTDFSVYDAALITENGGSSSMTTLADQGWQIPVVNIKAYSLYKGTCPLFFWSDSTFLGTEKSSDLLPGINWLFVEDNNDIFSGYQVGDSILWTTGYNTTVGIGAGEAHVQAFDLFKSHEYEVVKNSTPLASNKYLIDEAFPLQNFMWKTEENSYTKRIVSWGIHNYFLEYATDEFYRILKNSLIWVLNSGKERIPYLKNISTLQGKLYPSYSPSISRYNLVLQDGTDTVTFIADKSNVSDTVTGDLLFANIPGKATIKSTDANGNEFSYTIHVIDENSIAKLLSLDADVGELVPAFNPEILNYTLMVPMYIDSVTFSAYADKPGARVAGNIVISTLPGISKISVVTENGIVITYRIYVDFETYIDRISNDLAPVTFYPVPFEEELIVRTLPEAQIYITNLSGQIIFRGISNKNGELTLYAKDFERGMYIVTVRKDDQMISLKVLKR